MKLRIFVFMFAVSLTIFSVTIVVDYQNIEKVSDLVLQNVESLAQREGDDAHGNIDATLEPYYRESTKSIWFPGYGTTKIPCCEACSSQFSGCAKGLDRC